jgi:NAD(P)-dependent dehydrogenase (short-subunit alcohol dehydrogenase family)
VVTVASSAHRFGAIDFDDLQWERRPYKAWRAYGQSKLANLLFTAELQRKLIGVGSSIKATAAHPGYAATNLQFHSENRAMDAFNALANRFLAQDEDGGALPTLYAAVADVPCNSFAGPSGVMEWRGGAKLVKRTAAAEDTDVARRLWDASEQLTGVRFPLSGDALSTNADESVSTLEASH